MPLIVRWPGTTTPGRVVHGPVITQDLFPTLLRAAGVRPTGAASADGADGATGPTGIDLGPVFRGAEVPGERGLLWHQPHYWGVAGPGIEPYSALRLGRWKLVYFHASQVEREGTTGWTPVPRLELFDLHADLGETRDLAALEPVRTAAMAEQLSTALEAAGAAMSVVLATGEPTPLPRDFLAGLRVR